MEQLAKLLLRRNTKRAQLSQFLDIASREIVILRREELLESVMNCLWRKESHIPDFQTQNAH